MFLIVISIFHQQENRKRHGSTRSVVDMELDDPDDGDDNAPLFYQPGKRGFYSPRPGKNTEARLNCFRNIGRYETRVHLNICVRLNHQFLLITLILFFLLQDTWVMSVTEWTLPHHTQQTCHQGVARQEGEYLHVNNFCNSERINLRSLQDIAELEPCEISFIFPQIPFEFFWIPF